MTVYYKETTKQIVTDVLIDEIREHDSNATVQINTLDEKSPGVPYPDANADSTDNKTIVFDTAASEAQVDAVLAAHDYSTAMLLELAKVLKYALQFPIQETEISDSELKQGYWVTYFDRPNLKLVAKYKDTSDNIYKGEIAMVLQ